MTDSGRILQASKVFGRFDEIKDGNLMLSIGSEEGSEAVSPHFDMTIDFVDEWLGRNVEALVINNVCVRLTDKENGLAYPEAATFPAMEATEEGDETPIIDAHEHDDDCEHAEVSAEAPAIEVVESGEDEEPDDEAAEVPSFAVQGEAPVIQAVEAEEEEEQAELPSFADRVETAETKRIVWPPFEDEEEEEAPPVETPSHSYALSQSSSEPKTDDYRNRETEHFRF